MTLNGDEAVTAFGRGGLPQKTTSTEHMDVRMNQRIQQQQVQPANETPVQRSGT